MQCERRSWRSIEVSDKMTPKQFFLIVVQPNCADAIAHPQSLRFATNAIFALDAVVGITYWYLHDLGDASATVHNGDDSPYKAKLAQNSAQYQIIKDTAFALKHGRLTRSRRVPPLVKDASQFDAEVHTLSGMFKLDSSSVDGERVHISLATGQIEAIPIIVATLSFLENYVANLP